MTKDKFELSRRKALIGLGTIGVAGAGAGMGTSALFSDTESFTNNTIQAGTLNLALEGGLAYTNRENGVGNPDVGLESASTDGTVKMLIELSDVKPGDCYVFYIDECIEGNPAYLQNSLSGLEDYENGLTEPEEEVDETGGDPGKGNGELSDNLQLTLFYGGAGPLDGDEEGGDDDPAPGQDLVPISAIDSCDAPAAESPNNAVSDGAPPPLVEEQSLADAVDKFAEADENEPGDSGINDEFVPAGSSAMALDPGCWRKFWRIRLPKDVGNIVQGDSVVFSIDATIEQARNNDGSTDVFDGSPGDP